MSDFVDTPLDEVIFLQNDKKAQLKSSDYIKTGILPIVDQSSKFICGYTNDTTKKYSKPLPVIVFGDHTLHTKFINFQFAVGADGTQIIKTRNPDHDHKYLFYVIQRETKIMGSEGYKRHLKILKERVVPFNQNLPEQKKIASILTSVDEVIENTQKQIDKLQDLKKATMNELLTKGIGHTEFKDSELGRIPKSWEVTNLHGLVTVDANSLKGNTDPDYKLKYIDISCVSTGEVKPPSQYILFQDAPSRAKRIVKKNDVLVATVRPNLKAFAHFDEEGEDWIASTGFAVLQNKEKADSRFIYNVMLSDDVSRQIEKLVAGSNYPAINSSDIKELSVLAPPLPEQKKIASILTSVDKTIEEKQRKLSQTQSLKKSLMQDLLTGKVRVQVN